MNRLRNLLNDPWRPIQIIFAGKAHPSDNSGKHMYYQDSGEGFSNKWVALMKQAIKSTGARFSARRMVKEYIDKCYKPALSFV